MKLQIMKMGDEYMSIIILKPQQTEIIYDHAANVFQDFFEKVTGTHLEICVTDDGISDLVVIGSDAVNDYLMNEMLALHIGDLGIQYGTDDYCMYTYQNQGRRVLVLAGGRGRSTLYAVYDYFERYANCHYFWDGDVIPQTAALPMENINVVEKPRFFYRGLRYFAHRGLKRFQAEHWSFEDWKQEIDWMIKKRLNFFMLRIGMDDIWQRSFPEDVPYPEEFRTIDGIDASGYNDRSDFWTLKYRGELKIKVLEYAREMDLMYPTDCGTMTHWYSRTPVEFLERKKPSFMNQDVEQYTASDTGKVFDITQKENMDYYMHLTETMVNEHEKSTALFHTIGLGERKMYEDKDKNLALKRMVYRRIAENIRQRYPDSKLMLASWDFPGWWSSEDVASLLREFDPERTILLDYTSENSDPEYSFLKWDVVGKFPWVFGLFHAYESESELRGPYYRTDERLKIAAEDSYCKGMIFWPELSHSDPLVLEYLSQNSWSPLAKTVEKITEEFCDHRYGKHAEKMNVCWQRLLPFIELGEWGNIDEAQGVERIDASWYAHQDIWPKLTVFSEAPDSKNDLLKEYFVEKMSKTRFMVDDIVYSLELLASDAEAFSDTFILRDSVDLARTVLGRFLNYIIIKSLIKKEDKEYIGYLKQQYLGSMDIMSELLSLNSDFSIYDTLKTLEATAPTNPDFEITLKRNITNAYCSQPAYELVQQIYKAEGEAFFNSLLESKGDTDLNISEQYKAIFDTFMNTPLKDMQPFSIPQVDVVFLKVAAAIKELSKIL